MYALGTMFPNCFARTVFEAHFLAPLSKIKTHHWSVVTLRMRNMFGVVRGTRYGWPKNILHWKEIHWSTLDLCATVPIHFVIADGTVVGRQRSRAPVRCRLRLHHPPESPRHE